MPAIARADDNGINVIAFEDFLVKPIGGAISIPVVGIHELLRAGPAIREEIADCANAHVFLAEKLLKVPAVTAAHADARDRDPIRRGSCPTESERRGRHHQRRGGSLGERSPGRMPGESHGGH